MKINHRILNSKLANKFDRIEYISNSYKRMVKLRYQQKLSEKPVDLVSKMAIIKIYFLYTYENYNYVHNSIEKVFDKKDVSYTFQRLKKNENTIDQRGWSYIGNIVSKGNSDRFFKNRSLVTKNLPDHTAFISCNIHRILPSTSVLSFEFYLDEGFRTDLYKDFYSKNDVIVKADDFFKKLNIEMITSNKKFDNLLNEKVKYFENWILNFFKINSNSILSVNSITVTTLQNISKTKSQKEILERNLPFVYSQSFPFFSIDCYHNDDSYYLLENLNDIRKFSFKNNELEDFDFFITSILLLITIDTYKKKLEDIRVNSLSINKEIKIEDLNKNLLNVNTINFQILRLFQEIKHSNLDEFLVIMIEGNDLRTNNSPEIKYSAFLKSKIESSSNLLLETSLSIKSFLDKSFESATTETNFNLQNEMKRLSRVTIFITMVSIGITIFNSNWAEVKKNLESFRVTLHGK